MTILKENKVTDATKIFILRHKDLLDVDPSGEIIKYFAEDLNPVVRATLCERIDFLEICPSDLVHELALDIDENVRLRVVDHIHPGYKDATYLYTSFLTDDSPRVRAALAVKGEQLVDDRLNIEKYYFTKNLLLDENSFVIKTLLKWLPIDHLKNTDPNCKILLDLAEKFGFGEEADDIKFYIILCNKILEITGVQIKDEDAFNMIYNMSFHSKKEIRLMVAYRDDLLEIDPSGNLVRALANDEDEDVKDAILNNSNFEYDKYSGMSLNENLYENLLKNYISTLIK